MMPQRPRVLAAAVRAGLAVQVVLTALRLPSPSLFAGLVGGAVPALARGPVPTLPRWSVLLSQALIGVTIGETVTVTALRQVATDWPSVVAVVVVTLALSLASGVVLARVHRVSEATGVFSMIAGGASGITAIADELGADARVVSVLQHLRVLLVIVSLPVVVGMAFHPAGREVARTTVAAPLGPSLVMVTVSVGLGLVLARAIPVSTFTLIGPMAVAGGLALWGGLGPAASPAPLTALAMLVVGLQVGLTLDRDSLGAIRRLLPTGLALIAVVMLGCGLLGAVLSRATGVDPLTTYLATTPGGLFAVLATATSTGAEPTYVFAVQLARLVAILALAPLLARWLRARAGARRAGSS
nr:AbrB family transcriptional regulator [Arsenicicoccus dermatophilus]